MFGMTALRQKRTSRAARDPRCALYAEYSDRVGLTASRSERPLAGHARTVIRLPLRRGRGWSVNEPARLSALARLQIDDEIEFGCAVRPADIARLCHRRSSILSTKSAGASNKSGKFGSIRHQRPGIGCFAETMHRRANPRQQGQPSLWRTCLVLNVTGWRNIERCLAIGL